ncbi:methyltransferase, partial [Acinetobacter nosocomialis]
VQQAIETQSFERLILSQYKGALEHLEKMTFRIISLQNQEMMSCLYRYKTQDVTKNYPINESLTVIQQYFVQCKQANLFTNTQEIQLKKIKRKLY